MLLRCGIKQEPTHGLFQLTSTAEHQSRFIVGEQEAIQVLTVVVVILMAEVAEGYQLKR
jgi:hypothetical protein